MTRADLEAVRNPLAALVVVLAAAAAAVYYSHQLAAQARRELAQQQSRLKDARARLQRSGDERTLIVQYLGAYRQLQKRGFIGEEQRINWLDALRVTNEQADLFGVDYQIGTQKPYQYAAEFGAGPIELRESTMTLRFRLLHEGDLLRFLDLLARQGAGIYTVDECSMKRLDNRGVIRYQPNLAAECELAWITAGIPAAGTPEKKP
ncbi:MAG: hypothetical protein IT529_17800 [Burkholderiales bacterium]|nr:hypothetical protein [Burkholderiales bacterium]